MRYRDERDDIDYNWGLGQDLSDQATLRLYLMNATRFS